ncbi:MAG: hypothetical protein JWO94_3219 [Verrucomicrobiaceae bacterium]|nr:hypothetical protein [Verrucomicrobiaceae bacterium]
MTLRRQEAAPGFLVRIEVQRAVEGISWSLRSLTEDPFTRNGRAAQKPNHTTSMKTTLVLIIAAAAGMSFAGPSDSAAFAARAAQEAAARNEAASNRIALVKGAECQSCSVAQAAQKPQQTYVNRGQFSR